MSRTRPTHPTSSTARKADIDRSEVSSRPAHLAVGAELIDRIHQGIFVFSSTWNLTYINSTGRILLESFYETAAEQSGPLGKSVGEIFPEGLFPGWCDRMQVDVRSGMVDTVTARAGQAVRVFTVDVIRLAENKDAADTDFLVVLDEVTGLREKNRRLADLQKGADKGVFASSVAHELNNYLATLLGNTELAGLALKKGNMERVATLLEKLRINVQKTEQFSSRLAAFGRMDTHKATHNLNEIIGDVAAYLAGDQLMEGIDIYLNLDKALPKFPCDADQMAQLLLNTISNAADAIRAAGRADGQIVIRSARQQSTIVLSVSDNGCGISDEVREKLFVSRYSSKGSGYGFGLRRCARIVEIHDGACAIESTPGEGSVFSFTFPA